MKLVWNMYITDVREKSLTVGGKIGSDGTTELIKESAGWWIHLGNASLYAGNEKPPFEKGDAVRLVLEHSEQENSSNASEKTKS